MADWLSVACILGAGLLAGGLVAVTVAFVPLLGELERGEFVRIHHHLDSHFDPFMPILNILTMLSAAAWMAVEPVGWRRALVAVGLAMAVAVALVSQLGNRPINKLVATWYEQTIPETSGDQLRRWRALHYVRMAAAILGVLAYVVAGAVER